MSQAWPEVTWKELASHNSLDDAWLAIQGLVYNVTQWKEQHPGGAMVLMHLAGKDATEQFHAYHPAWAAQILKHYQIGIMTTCHPHELCKAAKVFACLRQDVEASGLMSPTHAPYYRLLVFLGLLFSIAAYCALSNWLIPAALLTALFWQQTAFIGHDLGHHAVSQTSSANRVLSLLDNVAVGIGMSWWKSTHNVHHIVVNAADSDPDIQFMPLLCVSEHFLEPVWSKYHQNTSHFDWLAQRLLPWQHITFIPLLMVARFGLYNATIQQLVHGRAYIDRRAEVASQVLYFTWYAVFVLNFPGAGRKLAFVLLSHAAFFVLHLQICLSHFACPTESSLPSTSEDWMTQQVRGTMNWSCASWMDWFHGGLQFQIEHHLFPRMPRPNLRTISPLVQQACREAGLRYHCPTFAGAIWETIQTLHSAGKEASSRPVNKSYQKETVHTYAVLSKAMF